MTTWKPVVGWEEFYEVSDDGQVRRFEYVKVGGGGSRQVIPAGPVASRVNPAGYLGVTLVRAPRRWVVHVHRLVIEAFVGPRPSPKHEVRHLDGDKSNNSAANLAWGTSSENKLDVIRHGRHPHARKTECHRGHPFDERNTLLRPSESGTRRECRACARIRKGRQAARAVQPAPGRGARTGLPDRAVPGHHRHPLAAATSLPGLSRQRGPQPPHNPSTRQREKDCNVAPYNPTARPWSSPARVRGPHDPHAHRRAHRRRAGPVHRAGTMSIQARYSGICPECGGRWQPGDLIRSKHGGRNDGLPIWQHVSCPDVPSDYEHHQPVCDRCWLSHAGECDR